MNYFGTSLTEKGHYWWKLDRDNMQKCFDNLKALPFDPYTIVQPATGREDLNKGDVFNTRANGCTICVIYGSCKDDRHGTCSMFWIKGNFGYEELREKILAIPIARKMIEQMPFTVNW